ncbi:hypothetical protein IQE94_02815 [Synechocystis sp. PCC 7339]|uniref:hypothetical protein n=1 Tax=unclassified Synechocystis TaxID=2640012 RepID=UPI001BAFB625|nr:MULTISPECIES: hypothetical protein [unclassified Synechocystis]QUS61098.1 hypothetical protein HTZ78_10750 [Synechocystis sp. PCC 7338]UAJ73281.1 hypothetical protein IQE94_02815 [Synechocystis sp. PCC 7339]
MFSRAYGSNLALMAGERRDRTKVTVTVLGAGLRADKILLSLSQRKFTPLAIALVAFNTNWLSWQNPPKYYET